MRILLLDTINGSICTSTHKWEVSSNLAKLGHEVYVMATTRKKLNGMTSYIQRKKEQTNIAKLVYKIKYFTTLFLQGRYFDVMYTRNPGIGLLGLLIKRIYGSKLVLELNGLVSEDWGVEKKVPGINGVLQKAQMKFEDSLEIFVAKKADAVVTVTQGIKDILIERGLDENKVNVIPNGANIDLFKPIENPTVLNRLRIKYNINDNAPIIMFLGSIESYQGIEYLINGAPSVLKTIPNTMFLIVGDGQAKDELIELTKKIGVSDKFIFTGIIPYEDVPLYINLAEVCVAPFILSRNDRIGLSPLKVYEYLACKKPVIASNIKNVADLLKSSNSGISVKPEDSDELANSIIKLLKDELLRKEMGRNGREFVVNNYSWKRAAIKTAQIFEKLLYR